MHTKVCLALLLISTTASAETEPVTAIPDDIKIALKKGAPKIELTDAPWCTDETEKSKWDTEGVKFAYNYDLRDAGDFFDIRPLRKIMIFACSGDGSDKTQRLSWVQSFMQARANRTGMTQDEQVATATLFATADDTPAYRMEKGAGDVCKQFDLEEDKPNPVTKAKNLAFRVGAGCYGTGADSWMIDRGVSSASSVETLGWLYTLFADGSSIGAMIAWHDANAFDVDTFINELSAKGFKGADLEHARLKYFRFRRGFNDWEAKLRKELYKDFDKLIRAYEKGFKEWDKAYASNKDAIDFSFKMEEASLSEVHGEKMRLFEGCIEQGRKHAHAFMKKKTPKTLEDLKKRGADPMGQLIFTAARECEKATGDKVLASGLASLVMAAPGHRGPRFFAQRAAAAQAKKIKKKTPDFPYSESNVAPRPPQYGYGIIYNSGNVGGGAGTVLRVKKRGKFAHITFKKIVTKNKHYNCRSTGRVKRVRRSGRVEMHQNCKSAASTILSRREKPIKIPLEFTKDIKKGRYLTFSRPSDDDEKLAFPNVVYKKKDSERIYSYYGFSLKK